MENDREDEVPNKAGQQFVEWSSVEDADSLECAIFRGELASEVEIFFERHVHAS